MQRRQFLYQSSNALLGVSLLPRSTWQTSPSPTADTWTSLVADIEEQVPRLMAETKTPGVSIVFIRDAKIAWRRGFGLKDASAAEPVDTDTMFEAASMSKPVFAYTVMKLCERGVMNLDTPLIKYTGERLLKDDPRSDLITARNVLSHTTGLQDWRSDKDPLSFHFTPGEKYLYSGEGYAYLQSVVTHLTGQPYETFIANNLLKPFHMDSSCYVWNEMTEKRMARGHDEQGKPATYRRSTPADVARYGSAGALLTTPADYAKSLIEIIDPKPADAFHLNHASLTEMLRPQVKVAQSSGQTSDYSVWWGLGWRIARSNQGETIGHGGSNPGFKSICDVSPAKRSGFVLMTNGDSGDALINKLVPPLAKRLYTIPS